MRKIFSLCLLIIYLFLFTGCRIILKYPPEGQVRFNAVLYDQKLEMFNTDFISKYDSYTITSGTKQQDRIIVVDNEESCMNIFQKNCFNETIDFNKKIIIVYYYTSTERKLIWLHDIKLENNILNITTAQNSYYARGTSSAPYLRWSVIVLDKQEFDSVYFNEVFYLVLATSGKDCI